MCGYCIGFHRGVTGVNTGVSSEVNYGHWSNYYNSVIKTYAALYTVGDRKQYKIQNGTLFCCVC